VSSSDNFYKSDVLLFQSQKPTFSEKVGFFFISISQQLIEAIKKMDKEKQEAFVEELLAVISPEYLASIREARKDYKQGRTYSHEEVFG
jgi:hypothetical protein